MRDWQQVASTSKTARGRASAQRGRVPGATTAPAARLAGGELAADDVLELQRLAGNEAATSLLARSVQREPAATGPSAASDDVYDQAEAESKVAAEDDRAIAEGGAAVDAAGEAPLAWHALPADMDGNAMFVLFDDVSVQKLFQALLRHWGLTGPGVEDTPGLESPPAWVGDFRAKALNVRPNAAYEGAADDARLARLAKRLADSVAAETPAQNARRAFVTEIQGRIGTAVMSQSAIDEVRKQPAQGGYTPANFTTCIAFFGQVMSQVTAKLGLPGTTVKGPNAYKEINPQAKETLGDRWVPSGGGARPKPGDLLIFTFNEDEKNADGSVKYAEGWFAHISIVRAVEPMEPDANGPQERWISIDGGGTTAKEVFRVYHPATNLIVGPPGVTRTMKGWIDIEAAVEKGLAPKG
jgi:hypothetical protein